MGQDFRAIEAGAHAYAARNGKYTALSQWRYKEDLQIIEGTLSLPLAVGTVGGVYNVHPVVKVLTKITGIHSAIELACVAAAVGLAQNFSALYALTTVGIQKGHMRLHAKNIALMAGAETREVDTLVTNLLQCKDVSLTNAQTLLHTMRNTQVAYK